VDIGQKCDHRAPSREQAITAKGTAPDKGSPGTYSPDEVIPGAAIFEEREREREKRKI
jgi:hypothetical protein